MEVFNYFNDADFSALLDRFSAFLSTFMPFFKVRIEL